MLQQKSKILPFMITSLPSLMLRCKTLLLLLLFLNLKKKKILVVVYFCICNCLKLNKNKILFNQLFVACCLPSAVCCVLFAMLIFVGGIVSWQWQLFVAIILLAFCTHNMLLNLRFNTDLPNLIHDQFQFFDSFSIQQYSALHTARLCASE